MKFRLSTEYGVLTPVHDTPHTGIDIAMPEGTTLRSVADGIVEKVVDYGSQNIGKGVFVRHEDGSLGIYGHMSNIQVHVGQHIQTGDVLGLSGNTGHSTGPHLHFGLKDASGQFVDPTPLAEQIVDMSGEKPIWSALKDWIVERGKVNTFENADYNIWTDLAGSLLREFGEFLQWGALKVAEFLTVNMPEIGALLTVSCGVLIMISGNVTKWLGVWSAGMMGAVLWLLNA
jgi:hypothetical protein